jgi:hypothetical protein
VLKSRSDSAHPGEMDSAVEALASFASERPLAAAVCLLALVWAIATYARSWASGMKLDSSASSSRDEAMRAARERQQAMLTAAEGRARASAGARAPAAVPKEPQSAQSGEMPARMRAAIERQEAEARAAASAAASAADGECTDKCSDKCSGKSTEKKMSYTERLARIEKGKGQSEFNPMGGSGASSTAGKLFQRKKGGG